MSEENPNSRLEAFCDAVFAIALTLLILEFKTPELETIHSSNDLWIALKNLLPSLYAFLLSFSIIAIQWGIHHKTMNWVSKTSNAFMYANIFLLLTVVMIPLSTSFLARFGFTNAAAPAVVLYTFIILMCNLAWNILTYTTLHPKLLAKNEKSAAAIKRLSRDVRYTFFMYLICVVLAFWIPTIISIFITLIWIYWFIFSFSFKDKY